MTREEKSIRRQFLIRIDAGFKNIKPMQRRAMVEILFICKNEIEARGLTKEDFCKDEALREHTLLLKNMGVKVKDGIKCANEISSTHWIYNIGDKDLGGTNVYTKAAYTEGNNYITVSINKYAMEKIYHVAVEPMDDEIAEYKSVKPQYATPENVTKGMLYCMNFLTTKQKEALMTIWKFYKEKGSNPLAIPIRDIGAFKDDDLVIKYKVDSKEIGLVTRYLITDIFLKDDFAKFLLNDDAVEELFDNSQIISTNQECHVH
jgi:hypothetical protein